MKESWANTSDAYRLLLQEIYGGRRARIGRVLVGSGAIAMQALVLITIGQHLCGFRSSRGAHWGYLRLDPKDAPGLSLQGRCLAFVMVGVQILQGDTQKVVLKVLTSFRFTYLYNWFCNLFEIRKPTPGWVVGQWWRVVRFAYISSSDWMFDRGFVQRNILGADVVLIVRSESVLKVHRDLICRSSPSLARLAKIDNWFCNLFDLDSRKSI